MRVIAGNLKGRKLSAVKGDNTRPTTDQIKENVFNLMGQFFTGGVVLDLFAGSGALGIEALSRGMDRALFVDLNQNAIRVIKENITSLQLGEQTAVYRRDAFSALKQFAKSGVKFDMIFLDPPYGKVSLTKLLDNIIKSDLLNANGLVMCEHRAGDFVSYDALKFTKIRQQMYGTIEILILEKVEHL